MYSQETDWKGSSLAGKELHDLVKSQLNVMMVAKKSNHILDCISKNVASEL